MLLQVQFVITNNTHAVFIWLTITSALKNNIKRLNGFCFLCILNSNANHKIWMSAGFYFSKLINDPKRFPVETMWDLRLVASLLSDEEMRKCMVEKDKQRQREPWEPLPNALRLTTMPSTRGITMPNLPTAPCSRILKSPVFRGWMKIRGTSFSSNPDLQQERKTERKMMYKIRNKLEQ